MKHLIQLLVDNVAKPHAVRFEAVAGAAHVYLKGPISADYGVSAADLRAAFGQAEGGDVVLHINSPGGDVFEGREMQAVIASHAGKVTALIEGVAASAATIVSMAANQVQMLRGSRYMIHNGWSIALGDKGAMRAMAELLDGFDSELAAEYAKKTGVDAAQVALWMDAETWFNADQAVEHGFADAIVENTKNEALHGLWNLSAYANAPADEPPPAPDYAAIRAANERRLRLFAIA